MLCIQKKIFTEKCTSTSIETLLTCRLIPLNKNHDSHLIEVEQILKRIEQEQSNNGPPL